MTGFLAAIVMVLSGGLLPLFLWRHFTTIKMVGALTIGTDCLIGLVDAVGSCFIREMPLPVSAP